MTNQTPKLILLTGVTKGCGRALLDEFISSGHHVIACGRNSQALGELSRRHPRPHRFDVVDVSDWTQVHSWASSILKEYSVPDFIVNNAATINPNAPLWEVDEEAFNQVIDTNIKGPANVIRAFVPAMVARKSGIIVNFSSGWGRCTSPEVAPYCASKWAIEGLTQALAQELPNGMAAVPLNPGIIQTEMLKSCFGTSAMEYPKPDVWAKKAAPFILGITPRQNGHPLSVEGFAD